ncbi:MAG: hypothetical protein HQ564_08490 [Candidatus Saganbacteria bacterium]|nr:hypothetical protein [Candidatus Saganbacteria bacterium]
MRICIFEDKEFANFLPLTHMRPVWDLIAGPGTIRQGLEKLFNQKINSFYSKRADFSSKPDLSGDYLFVNGRLLPDKRLKTLIKRQEKLFVSGGKVIAFKGNKEEFLAVQKKPSGMPQVEADLKLVEFPWELISNLSNQLKRNKISREARISNLSVLDDSGGPIHIGEGTVVHPFSYLRGPLYIGRHCRIAGEVIASIIHDYVNKGHYGFLGHSYLCSFVNLGAGTTNSNLKNNYGSVKVVVNGKKVDTLQTFVGCFVGDHAKTAIGTLIYTGCVIGVSANIFGVHHVKGVVPSFVWGEKGRMRLDRVLETAKAVMARRDVEFSVEYAKLMEKIYEIEKDKKDNS